MKIRNLIHDEQLISCVISSDRTKRASFAVLLELNTLRPESEIPPECRGVFRRALPAIKQAMAERKIPSVTEGRGTTLTVTGL
ncbi:MAG: hypothetical protein PUA61_03945 [Succinatimonas hippei]|nr:hypothetical protein [Succinatimonas hippei]